MARLDYLDDPNAPQPNSLVPSVNVAAADASGRVLMIQRSDNGNWALPGGGMDLGESIRQAAVRETKEETGIDVEITGLVGIYTDPGHVIEYTSDGEVRQEFSVVFAARPVGGEPTKSDESTEVAWLNPAVLLDLPMHASMRLRIQHYLDHRAEPYLG